MNQQKDWLKFIKKVFQVKRKDTSKMEITPYRDWAILMWSAFVVFSVSLGFNIYMSININQDNFFGSPTPDTSGTILNKAGLDSALGIITSKEALFEKTRTQKITVVDPSL